MLMSQQELARKIKDANRQVYNVKDLEHYNENDSIFNDARLRTCTAIIKDAAERSGSDCFLDIGTGTGNMIRIAAPLFSYTIGTDISENMLAHVQTQFSDASFAACDADALCVRSESVNVASCYAMLHHLLSHETLFSEAYRILKPGGTLYTDHDPNYFLNRFYHRYYNWRYKHKPGFGSDAEELAEYHNTQSPGINPEQLKSQLHDIGFSSVDITYRHTDKQSWSFPMSVIVSGLKLVSAVLPLKSLYSHFAIVAVK
jgi:ubiquinone/menaquinone biosynthesis C-methylase UbiE